MSRWTSIVQDNKQQILNSSCINYKVHVLATARQLTFLEKSKSQGGMVLCLSLFLPTNHQNNLGSTHHLRALTDQRHIYHYTMRWLRILAGLLLVVCSTKADVTTSSYIRLRDAANQAHRDIPALRRADQQHWRTHVQSTILQVALHEKQQQEQQQQQQQQQTRRLEDYYYNRYYTNRADASVQEQVDQQYDATQYGSYGSFEQYGDFQLYDNLWDPSMAETEFGFDITHYSFKYTGCHDVGQRWQQAETRPTRYATFRLCPSDACSGRSTFGCKTNYGEYIVPVDVLVISLIEHNQARVTGYCQYCERCAALESYKQFASEILMHKQYILNYADTRFKSWCSRTFSRMLGLCKVCCGNHRLI